MELAAIIFVILGFLVIYLLSQDIYLFGYDKGYEAGYSKGLQEAIKKHQELFKIIGSENVENN